MKGVSDIPDEESNYFVEIEFPKGLTTNYKRKVADVETDGRNGTNYYQRQEVDRNIRRACQQNHKEHR